MKTVTSAENASYKLLRKLIHSSRERKRQGVSVLDGVHLVRAYAVNVGAPQQLVLTASGGRNQEIVALAESLRGAPTVVLSDTLFKALSSVDTPTGVLAVVATPRPPELPHAVGPCLLLEDIQDPGNLGSMLRSAAAAGIKRAFLSPHCVQAWSPRVLRAGMGAHFMIDIYENSDLRVLARSHHGKTIAADQHSPHTIYDSDLSGDIALMLGNEGSGLTPQLRSIAQECVAVPMAMGTESLNVAAAAAVILFERVRQRQRKQ